MKLPLIGFLLVYFGLVAFTLKDYGITWDSALGEFYIGDKNARFLETFDSKYLDYSADNLDIYHAAGQPDYYATSAWVQTHPEHVWSLGPTLSALSREIFFTRLGLLGPVDAQHCFLVLLMLALFAAVFRFTAEEFDPLAGFAAVLMLAAHPRLFADAHNNIKDVPLLVFLSIAVMGFYRGFTAERPTALFPASLALGLALASKANALFLPFIIVPWLFVLAPKRALEKTTEFIYCGLFAVIVCLICSPYLLLNFPQHLLEQLRYVFQLGTAGTTEFSLIPAVEAVATTPVAYLVCFVLGLLVFCSRCDPATKEKRLPLLLLFWLLVPVLRVSLPHSNDFDGIRHWMEFLVPMAIIAGVGASRIIRQFVPGALQMIALLALLVPTAMWDIRNHPFQICYYNSLVGGLKGAQERNLPQATDYWGSSYRAGLKWLNAHAEPGAELVGGVGEHIVQAVAKVWIRKDISLEPFELFQIQYRQRLLPPNYYLMYVTRKERYPELVRKLDEEITPEYSVRVDGGEVLKIVKVQAVDVRALDDN